MTRPNTGDFSSTNKFPFVTFSILLIAATLSESIHRVNGKACLGVGWYLKDPRFAHNNL